MELLNIILYIFIVSFFINLLWEFIHCQLYETCLKAQLKKLIPLLLGASLKDGIWISVFYFSTYLIFQNINILTNGFQLGLFVLLGFTFSFIDEKISLKMKRWEYSKQMPTLFGVGITPLLEISATGLLAFVYVF